MAGSFYVFILYAWAMPFNLSVCLCVCHTLSPHSPHNSVNDDWNCITFVSQGDRLVTLICPTLSYPDLGVTSRQLYSVLSISSSVWLLTLAQCQLVAWENAFAVLPTQRKKNSLSMASTDRSCEAINSGIWGHAPHPLQGKLKSHVKNGTFCAFWGLYLDKFTVPHVVIFRHYGVKLEKRLFVPKSVRYWVSSVSREFKGYAQRYPWGSRKFRGGWQHCFRIFVAWCNCIEIHKLAAFRLGLIILIEFNKLSSRNDTFKMVM